MRILASLVFILFCACNSAPETRRTEVPQPPRRVATRPKPEHREVANIPPAKKLPQAHNLVELLKGYDSVINNLSAADERELAGLKDGLSRFLAGDAKNLSILTESGTDRGWFAEVLVAVNPDGRAFFVDKKGKWFTEQLKDRIIGGTYTDDEGRTHLLTLFFADPTSPTSYHAYLGTQKIEVVSFELDRERSGSIMAKLRFPNGKLVSLARQRRDSKEIRVDGHSMNPLFL